MRAKEKKKTVNKDTERSHERERGYLSECVCVLWWYHWKWSLIVVMSRLGVWGGGGNWCYKKAWRSLSCGGLLSSCKEWSRVCVCASACTRACVCTGADDRGHGLHTRGTANEKEAFPLTFHGSQKQFAQRKVAKQPQCYSVEQRGGRKKRLKTNCRVFFLSSTWTGREERHVQYLTIKQTKHDSI